MVNYFYVCSKEDEKYSVTFRSVDCVKGDRNNLVEQVASTRDFCKDGRAISYDYFLKSINADTVLYITTDSGNVLGCCSISINSPEYIGISCICVPDRGIKGIGTALIDKLKEFANSLGLPSIGAAVDPSVQTFYLKNGFKIINGNDDGNDDDFINDTGYTYMRYTLPKGGKTTKTKTKSKKTKKANKSKKVNKKKKKA